MGSWDIDGRVAVVTGASSGPGLHFKELYSREGAAVFAGALGDIEMDINRGYLGTASGQRTIGRIPTREFGAPDDLNGALLLLCSDLSRHMTGSFLAADGGHLVTAL